MPAHGKDDCCAVRVARTFFKACTKLSDDDEDILPQVCFHRAWLNETVECRAMRITSWDSPISCCCCDAAFLLCGCTVSNAPWMFYRRMLWTTNCLCSDSLQSYFQSFQTKVCPPHPRVRSFAVGAQLKSQVSPSSEILCDRPFVNMHDGFAPKSTCRQEWAHAAPV
jgi:hypothetical protein